MDNSVVDMCIGKRVKAAHVSQLFPDLAISTGQEQQPEAAQQKRIHSVRFRVVSQLLLLGFNVLYTDVDVAILQNPFAALTRDHDVEGLMGISLGPVHGVCVVVVLFRLFDIVCSDKKRQKKMFAMRFK